MMKMGEEGKREKGEEGKIPPELLAFSFSPIPPRFFPGSS
jgi:hypothetical protein